MQRGGKINKIKFYFKNIFFETITIFYLNFQVVSHLIEMAEPELSGLRQERHAKTIEIAQKEVLTCIGKDF